MPWVGPVGARPVGLYRKPLQLEDIQPGAWLIAKSRAVVDDLLGRRLQSPFELCRVLSVPAQLSTDMLVPVEFLFADR